jgi:aspartyl-tRNA synthetase
LLLDAGAKGLAYIRVRADKGIDTIGAIKDNLTPEQLDDLLSRTQAEEGTLLLFGAGPADIVNATLDRLRQAIAKEMDMIPEDAKSTYCGSRTFPCLSGTSMKNVWRLCTIPLPLPIPEDIDDLKTARAQWLTTSC